MRKAVSVKTMRYSDSKTIESGTSSSELIKRAGRALFCAHEYGGKTAVICGKGNNAADGFVLAELLFENRHDVTVFLLDESFSDDGRTIFDGIKALGVHIRKYSENTSLSEYDTVVDCIFGTGFKGPPSGIYADAIDKINASGGFVISADINSGLDGDCGLYEKAVVSDLTVTMEFEKAGQLLGSGRDVAKRVITAPVGISLFGDGISVPEHQDFSDILRTRARNCHKGSFGYVGIIGGCREYSGAAKLANIACAALSSGCGVTKLCVPQAVCDYVGPYLLESTLFPMPSDDNGRMLFSKGHLDDLMNLAVIAIGMGWGRSEENVRMLLYLLNNYKGRLIIDADGLNALSLIPRDELKNSVCESIVLTPHPLEFSRLCGASVDEILHSPVERAKAYASEFDGRVILLLKGASSVITDGRDVFICDRGSSGMATAGSGDVLSGILTGILGYNSASCISVCCGAYAAGLAGEMAAKEKGEISALARDTVSFVPQAILEITNS